jgi:hypothetical protein
MFLEAKLLNFDQLQTFDRFYAKSSLILTIKIFYILKGSVAGDFKLLIFSSKDPPGPQIIPVKYFRIRFQICRDIRFKV